MRAQQARGELVVILAAGVGYDPAKAVESGAERAAARANTVIVQSWLETRP